jgi:hypothetical protein
MARIRCKYIGCAYLDQGLCAAPVIELDPDEGCMTFTQIGDPYDDDDDWDEDDLDGYQEWDDDDFDDPLYDDDDDDF